MIQIKREQDRTAAVEDHAHDSTGAAVKDHDSTGAAVEYHAQDRTAAAGESKWTGTDSRNQDNHDR